jgi:hypothetical protein
LHTPKIVVDLHPNSLCSVARLSRPVIEREGLQKILLIRIYINSGCSVARLSRLLWEQEAAGSNPATPTKILSGIQKGFFYIQIIKTDTIGFRILKLKLNFAL